jgi:hypothetical protein
LSVPGGSCFYSLPVPGGSGWFHPLSCLNHGLNGLMDFTDSFHDYQRILNSSFDQCNPVNPFNPINPNSDKQKDQKGKMVKR